MRTLRPGDEGSQVEELQSILQLIGYYDGTVDGDYGPKTKAAVAAFQRDFGLTSDGIAGPRTYEALKPFLLGYDTYTIKPGDTFYKIAKRYYTSLPKILTANPDLNPFLLPVGAEIIVPYGIDVVQTNISYTYDIMERDINGLKARYPFLRVDSIGNSVEGRKLYRIRLGNGPNKVTYNASHHANEWITTPILMKWIEEFSMAYSVQGSIRGYNTQDFWNQTTIDIIPMVNPDGVNLVINGITPEDPRYEELIQLNNGSQDFSRWKANIRGVDLNRNYNAAWDEYKELEDDFGVDGPGPYLYAGPSPVSEPETKAMVSFTENLDPSITLAYHTQGEVIFWDFRDLQPPTARTIAEQFSRVSGYAIAEPARYQAYAGYKDWFIKDFRRPGYTIEAGRGVNPLPITQFDQIYEDNEELLLLAATV